MTFTQLTTRLKNFLRGWLLVLSLKEGLVECATVYVKSEVMLTLGNNTMQAASQIAVASLNGVKVFIRRHLKLLTKIRI